MKITKFKLSKFKPLAHGGVKDIEVSNLAQLSAISGDNGAGKSSCLAELTPYPAVRTMYEPKGMKVLHIDHQDHKYVLTSHFKSAQSPAHSFKMDGIELNESGTMEVQEKLVEQHFDYSKLLDKLLAGNCKLSKMSKPDRKHLIMSTYPSSLLFILDHHKNVCKKIRAFKNQIKFIKTREVELTAKIMSQSVLKHHRDHKQLLDKAIHAIDQDVFAYRKYLEQAPDIHIDNQVDSYVTAVKQIGESFNSIYERMEIKPTIPQAKRMNSDFSISKGIFESLINSLISEGTHLREEISKFRAHLDSDGDAIKECKQLIKEEKQRLKSYEVPKDALIVDEINLADMQLVINEWNNLLEQIVSLGGPFWSKDTVHKAERKLKEWHQQAEGLRHSMYNLSSAINSNKKKLETNSSRSYPPDCKVKCGLRDTFATFITSVKNTLEDQLKNYDIYEAKEKELVRKSHKLEDALSNKPAAIPLIDRLNQLIDRIAWGKYVLNGETLIHHLNHDPHKLVRNFAKLIEHSSNQLKYNKCKQNLMVLESRLVSMQSVKRPNKDLITRAMLEKEARIEEIKTTINQYKSDIKKYTRTIDDTNLHLRLVDRLQETLSNLTQHVKDLLQVGEIALVREEIEYLLSVKTQINDKLRELDSVIDEQDNYIIRLRDEITPALKSLNKELAEHVQVEAQLSPVSGLPHKYIVSYVNSLFIIANRFINEVWDYEMSLALFNEEDPFDYSFKVIFNNDSEVKDVSILSTGQQSIVNLAVTLAICIYREFSIEYPLKLDEIDTGLTPAHRDRLTEFLNMMLHKGDTISQVFIVDHFIAVCSGFIDAAFIPLSADQNIIGQDNPNCKIVR